MTGNLNIQRSAGKFIKEVKRIVTYLPSESPSLDIDVIKAYTVHAVGSAYGEDRFRVSVAGRPVLKRARIKPLRFFERLRATLEAKRNVQKHGGIDASDTSKMNTAIHNYNNDVCLYGKVKGGQSIDVESIEEVRLENISKGDLERIL